MKRTVLTLVMLLLATPLLAGTVTGKAECGKSCDSFVVYLEGGPARDGSAEEAVVFNQKEKVFMPHVLPVVKGTTVQITNGDPFLHNVHIYKGKETVLNLAMPFQGQVVPYVPEETGSYEVACDAHPEMAAHIVVLSSPHFAVAAADGSYEINDVPAGSYTLVVEDLDGGKAVRSPVTVQ